jgi:hypothetical protein
MGELLERVRSSARTKNVVGEHHVLCASLATIMDLALQARIRIDAQTQQGSILDVIRHVNPNLSSGNAANTFKVLTTHMTIAHSHISINGYPTPVADARTLIEMHSTQAEWLKNSGVHPLSVSVECLMVMSASWRRLNHEMPHCSIQKQDVRRRPF